MGSLKGSDCICLEVCRCKTQSTPSVCRCIGQVLYGINRDQLEAIIYSGVKFFFSLGSKKYFLSMEYKNHLFLYILGATGAGLDSVWGPSGARLGSVWDFSSGWLAEIFVAPDQKNFFFQITTVFLPRGRFGFRLGLVWRRPDLSGTPRPSGWLKLSSPPVCFPSRYNIFLFPSQFLFWVYINYLLKY